MQFVKKVLVAVLWFLYRVSGLQALVDWADNKVFVYRKRLQMVPTSFKWFVWFLGVAVGVSGSMIYYQVPEIVKEIAKPSEPIVYINPAYAKMVETEKKEEVVATEAPFDIVDYIFMKESSRGVNNYSKCEAIGKYNRYGFGIPGDGTYVCFDKDQDTVAVAGWVAHRRALGMSDNRILCLYNTGKATETCGYLK